MSVQKEVSSMESPCSTGNAAEQFLIMNSFGLPESTEMASAMCAQELASTIKNGNGKKRKKLSESVPLQSHYPLVSSQNVEAEQHKDVPTETAKSPMEQKNEASETKEDYIHVRAKRGQATNSHSLAERVRREKISERMRLLQDLVPGCNKITGKAVMLDEIINYVQSLQRQVEFLSMKLAAVNSELNLDTEQIFTKENLLSRFGSSPALGYCPQIATSHPQLQPGNGNSKLTQCQGSTQDCKQPSYNLYVESMGR